MTLALQGAGIQSLGAAASPNYLSFPSAGYNVFTPHTAAMNPGTATLDLRAKVALNNWVPGGNNILVSSWGSANQFLLYIDATGHIAAAWTNAAAVGQFPISTVVTGLANGATKWIRALITITAGTCDFFTSDDGVTWTPNGAQRTGLTTTAVIVPGTPAQLRDGDDDTSAGEWTGKFYRSMLIIGGVTISDMDFSLQTLGATNTTFVATTGETWTIQNSAIIANT